MSAPRPPLHGWSLRACAAAAGLVVLVGLIGATLTPRLPPDDAFRARLEQYRLIGEALGRGPTAARTRETDGVAPAR